MATLHHIAAATPNQPWLDPRPTTPACPALGLYDDRATRALMSIESHRCWARSRPRPIALDHQESHCLTTAYTNCPFFADHAANQAGPRLLVETERSERQSGRPHLPLRWPERRLLALVLAVALAVAAVGAVRVWPHTRSAAGSTAGRLPAEVTPSAPAATEAVQSPVVAAPTAAASVPTPAPATASPAPRPSATATPVSYTVQPGDGLSLVAERYGVSVAALAQANGLPPTALLEIGQVLRIPVSAGSVTPAATR